MNSQKINHNNHDHNNEFYENYREYMKLPVKDRVDVIMKELLTPENRKEDVTFELSPSSSSCKISDIIGFVYGGFSSRFWMFRKHIMSMTDSDLQSLPFYCWECLTIKT